MKTPSLTVNDLRARNLGVFAGILLAAQLAHAADVTKSPTGALSAAGSWVGGVLPGSANTALFDGSTVTGAGGTTFDASGSASSLTWGAMAVTNIAGPLNFTNVSTVTFGATPISGVILDMSTAAADVTFDSGTVRLGAPGAASLNVATGRTFTANNLTNNSGTRTYTFTGGGNFVVNGGSFLSGGAASAIINNASMTLNGNGSSLLTGSVTLQSGSLNFGNNAALGTKTVTATGGTVTASGGARTIDNGFTLSNSVTFGGSNDLAVNGAITGAGALLKNGAGVLTLGNTGNSYTGSTTVSAGTLLLGASNVITDSSNVVLAGGTLDTGTFSETAGTFDLNGTSAIVLGLGGSLAFSNSSALDWGSSILAISGSFVDGFSVRFGADATGLTAGQLSQITINGNAAGIDSAGYLVAVPEPSTVAFLGVGLAGLLWRSRRSRLA